MTSATRVVDWARRQPGAVLQGRPAAPLSQGRPAQPAVPLLVRERVGASALAGRQAAPDALQVAARGHLRRHVGAALKTLRHSPRWHQLPTATWPDLTGVIPAAPAHSAAARPLGSRAAAPGPRAITAAARAHLGAGSPPGAHIARGPRAARVSDASSAPDPAYPLPGRSRGALDARRSPCPSAL